MTTWHEPYRGKPQVSPSRSWVVLSASAPERSPGSWFVLGSPANSSWERGELDQSGSLPFPIWRSNDCLTSPMT